MSEVGSTPIALTGANQLVWTGPAVYRGITLRETAGAVATVRVFDGTSAAGTLLQTISLAANESRDDWYTGGGLWARTGIYVSIAAGTVEGSIRVG